jgi:NitT/TauT family transport system permease protein
MQLAKLFQVLRPILTRAKFVLGSMSFVLPIVVWSIVSYVPAVWHPQVRITDPGSVDYLQVGMRMDKYAFADAVKEAAADHKDTPKGMASNPIYLPAPHEVAAALYTSFMTPPPTQDSAWLHQSLWHSIQVIFWGFVISSILGVPVGILCGTAQFISPEFLATKARLEELIHKGAAPSEEEDAGTYQMVTRLSSVGDDVD